MPHRPTSQSPIDRIKELLVHYPDDVLLLLTLGRRYMEQGDYSQAEKTFLKSIDLDPSYSVTYRYLGEAHAKRGDPSRAAKVYSQGIQIARDQGDLQAAKEMEVFLNRLTRRSTGSEHESI